MAKKNPLIWLAGLGVLSFGALALAKSAGDVVTGKSGKRWRVVFTGFERVVTGMTSDYKGYEVFTPAGSFGPHAELSVLKYVQKGSDQSTRKISGVGQGVPEAIVKAAAADFGLPFDSSLMPH